MLKKNEVISAFADPDKYRDQLKNGNLIKGHRDEVSGKTFMCLHVTRFCPVNCKFCFFKSAPVYKRATIQDRFSDEGFEKLKNFANSINLGYLLVSGGGEPMMEKKLILRIVKEFRSERISIVTSGNWAASYKQALRFISDLKTAVMNRDVPGGTVTLRISLDKDHIEQLGLDPICNIIRIFHSEIPPTPEFDLQLHSLVNDETIDQICRKLSEEFSISRNVSESERISDGISVMKIVPKRELISFDHLELKIGYAKIFYSDMRVDLNGEIDANLEVFQKDMFESEDGNSSIVTNKIGAPGLDFWMNYNGNVTTWGNQILDIPVRFDFSC